MICSLICKYTAKLDTERLKTFVRDLKGRELSKKSYNLRMAAEETSFELTGYVNNAVSPFGTISCPGQTLISVGIKANLPIIITKSISELTPGLMFLG